LVPLSKRGEIVSIQQLRGIAAFGVLCFHACSKAGLAFGTGAAGVDIFFVISGFIMWTISVRAPMGPGGFLLRRAVRIIPLYWLASLALVGAALAAPTLFPGVRAEPSHVLKSLLFLPHLDPAGQAYPVIAAGWTLNDEIFFYLLFALAMAVFARGRAVVVSAILLALVLLRPLADLRHPIAAAFTDPILLEFAAGLWVGAAFTSGRLPGPRTGIVLALLGAGGLAVVHALGLEVSDWRLALWGAPALLIVAGAVSAERGGWVVRAPVLGPALARLGDASYSIYLVHGLLVSAAAHVLAKLGLSAPPVLAAGGVAAGLAGGFVVYALVEKPLTRALGRLVRARADSAAAVRRGRSPENCI
jgi:exopolysaccharide production protein ExoZ